MSYNWKEAEFEIERRSKLIKELKEKNATKDARIAELEEALMNIEEYATHIPLHFSSDNKKHRDRHIQHFVNQILEHCKAKGGE